MNQPHPSWLRRISDDHSGGVSEAEHAAVAAHLAECPACREALASYRRFYLLAAAPTRLGAPRISMRGASAMHPTDSSATAPTGAAAPARPRRALVAITTAAAVLIASFLVVFATLRHQATTTLPAKPSVILSITTTASPQAGSVTPYTLHALDAQTGKELWHIASVMQGLTPQMAVCGDQIALENTLVSGPGWEISLNAYNLRSGQPTWTHPLGAGVGLDLSKSDILACSGKMLYQLSELTGGAGVTAFALQDGKYLWSSGAPVNTAQGSVFFQIAGKVLLVGANAGVGSNMVFGLNPASGQILWSLHADSLPYGFAAIAPDGATAYLINNGQLLAVRVRDGAVQWQTNFNIQAVENVVFTSKAMILVTRPVSFDNIEPKLDTIIAVKPDTGADLWDEQLCCDLTPPQITAQGATLYIQAYNARTLPTPLVVSAVNAAFDAPIWSWSTPGPVSVARHTLLDVQGTLITNGTASASSDSLHALTALDAATGQPRYQIALPGAIAGASSGAHLDAYPTLAPGVEAFYATLTVVSDSGVLPQIANAVTEYSSIDGKLLWQTPLQGSVYLLLPVAIP